MDRIFSYQDEYRHVTLPHGSVTWDRREVVAVSKPFVTPAEAIEFFFDVECLLPQGWAGDPEVTMISDGRVSVRGIAD